MSPPLPGNQQIINTFTPHISQLYDTHVMTNHIQHMPLQYKVELTKAWYTTPITPISNTPIRTLHITFTPFKYNPQQYVYTYNSFIPPYEYGGCNIIGLGNYNPINDLHIATRFLGLQIMFHAQLYAILPALNATKCSLNTKQSTK